MSFAEKRSWIYAAIAVVIPVIYLSIVLRRLNGTGVAAVAVADIGYITPMLTAIGAAMVLNIGATITAAALAPGDADRKDERDRQINRLGEYVAFYVMSIVALVPLGLAMAEADYFWIANALYVAFVLAALASAVVKIVAYRRGL